MNESLQTVYSAGSGVALEQRNRVLRNTYWLLALSLVPTVLGAWIGVSTGVMNRMGVGMSAIIFLAGAFGFIFAIEKTKDSAAGVAVLLGFTFFMGLMLGPLYAWKIAIGSIGSEVYCISPLNILFVLYTPERQT